MKPIVLGRGRAELRLCDATGTPSRSLYLQKISAQTRPIRWADWIRLRPYHETSCPTSALGARGKPQGIMGIWIFLEEPCSVHLFPPQSLAQTLLSVPHRPGWLKRLTAAWHLFDTGMWGNSLGPSAATVEHRGSAEIKLEKQTDQPHLCQGTAICQRSDGKALNNHLSRLVTRF